MEMEVSAAGIARTKSDKLEMAAAAAAGRQSSLSRTSSAEALGLGTPSTGMSGELNTGSGGMGRKASFGKRLVVGGSSPGPGRKAGHHHTRKSRSAQLKLDLQEDVGSSSSAALSRASSASLGFSFSFTGFTAQPEDIVDDLKVFSDQETAEGSASPGEVLALMGPSGSGKTTLLSLLGGRTHGGILRGSMTYNNEPYTKSLKSRTGFVTQDDVLFAHLTVRETLTYAALLRLPKTMKKQQKEQRAMDVIYELGLERCQDTVVGGSFVRGVSGGERKRVCIGNEFIINPSLLFLDEPTSGLDSTTALRIVQMLHDIAETGKTVITTIHQPSSRLFHKFDKLVLLGKGSLLYLGKASEAMTYFLSIGCSPLITMNPAEFMLDLANGNINDVSIPSELEDRVQMENSGSNTRHEKPSPKDVHEYLVEAYDTRVADKERKKLLMPIPINEDLKAMVTLPKRDWGASWWQQYSILFWRGLKERRHDYLSWMRVTQVLATAIILGLLWWHSDSATPKGLQDQAGLLFFISVFWGFFPVFTAIFTFPQERAMLNKERAADMYRLSAYFMARTTADLPLDLILPVFFMLIVYFMTGLRQSAESFFLSMLTVFLSIVAAQGLGLVIGAKLMDIKKATTLASVTVMTFMLAGGFFVKKVPVFISWIRYISFNYHTYRLLLKVQYDRMPPSLGAGNLDNSAWEVYAMIAMVLGYRLLAYISLRMMKPLTA